MPRDERVDALRGLALFGILAVNIQCFVTGLDVPSLGILDSRSTLADHCVVLLTAFLLEFKFYPLFCFCFGYGFAVQTRRWARERHSAPAGVGLEAGVGAGERFTRRMNALLCIGLLHGGLLWFGDILTRYAIAGHVLRRYAGCGPRGLLRAAKMWLAAALVLTVVLAGMMAAGAAVETAQERADRRQAAQSAGEHAMAAYTHGSYVDATIQRVHDFAIVTAGFIMVLPQIMAIFLAGAITAQLGLLRYPARHRDFWRRMLRLGLIIGIPINAVYAWTQWQASQHPWSTPQSVTSMVCGDLAPILSIAIIAGVALLGDGRAGRLAVRLLAPAGRRSLTLYVGQSVAMALLLSGFGLGLGAVFGPARLFFLAVVIQALLLAASHFMQRHAIRGSLETLWRRLG